MKMTQGEIVSLSHSHRFFALVTPNNFLLECEDPSPTAIAFRLGYVSAILAEVRESFGGCAG